MRHITRRSGIILAAAFGLTFGVASSVAAQTVRIRPTPVPSWIGVGTRDVAPSDVSRDKLPGEWGAYVNDLSSGGPADKAGIRTGDVIVEFDGVRVRSSAELQRLVRETPPGRTVKVAIVRGGKRSDIAVTTGPNPNGRTFSFDVPMPEFRGWPQLPRDFPEYQSPPFNRPRPGTGLVFPGPIPLRQNPWLGIGVQDLTPQLAEYFRTKEGVLVATVEDGSPAMRAGVKAGDIIMSIDGRTVTRRADVTSAVRGRRAGEEVSLGIVRDGKPLTIKVTLAGDRRGAAGRF